MSLLDATEKQKNLGSPQSTHTRSNKSETQQFPAPVLELKEQFLGFETKLSDLDIFECKVTKEGTFLWQITGQIFFLKGVKGRKVPKQSEVLILKVPEAAGERETPPASALMDASQHPSGIWNAAFFSVQLIRRRGWESLIDISDATTRTVFDAGGFLHCFCQAPWALNNKTVP